MIRNRVYLGEQATSKLRSLQQRTQVTPNLLCRMGFCVSIEDPAPIDVSMYQDGSTREFNLPTLVGQYQELFFALLRERMTVDAPHHEVEADDLFRAHVSRGVIQLSLHVNKLEDLTSFVVHADSQELP